MVNSARKIDHMERMVTQMEKRYVAMQMLYREVLDKVAEINRLLWKLPSLTSDKLRSNQSCYFVAFVKSKSKPPDQNRSGGNFMSFPTRPPHTDKKGKMFCNFLLQSTNRLGVMYSYEYIKSRLESRWEPHRGIAPTVYKKK